MSRFALVIGDVVATILDLDPDSDWQPPAGSEAVAVDPEVAPGWQRQGDGTMIPPPPLAPTRVSPLQIRRAIRESGLKPQADAWLAAQDDEVAEAWEYATEIARDHPFIIAAAAGLELDAAAVDDLFRLAAGL